MKVLVTQWYPTLQPHGVQPTSFLCHEIQARILEWVAIPFSKGILTQGRKVGVLQCRLILYYVSYQEEENTQSPPMT